ncbi:hypothetical protein ACIBQ6_36820 [Nonomuraea sp. NPDC049655]|uniref:hypothetical protein n=1 Tax=Nonomuraea sp. NPDC049655 TaxID=3364355 RepID=UPI0037ABD4D4
MDAGAVRAGGVDVRSISTEALTARIAIVFQDVYLFDGTIEENVRLGRPGASLPEVRAARCCPVVSASVSRLIQEPGRTVGVRPGDGQVVTCVG